jgi:putative membrane protein
MLFAWIKVFHVTFMVAWFAGLFYLPRLFVYHAEAQDQVGRQRFCVMERRLAKLMSIAALGTIFFGAWLLALLGWGWLAATGWMQAKLVLVAGLVAYHGWCQIQIRKFRQQRATNTSKYYRAMNELPSLLLILILILVFIRPF